MSTSRSILVQRLKETVGLSKATYDEALAESMSKLNDLDTKLGKLKHLMTNTVEKLARAADAGRMSVVDAVIGLCDDIPGGAPPECETYRDTMKNLHETMPARLTTKFEEVVIVHINEWQAKIEATHEAYKIFSTARVKLDHYKEKVDGIQQKMARGSLDAKMQDQLQRNRRKYEDAQTQYAAEREKLLAILQENFANGSLLFDKLLLRLMQFDMQYYKDAHAASSPLVADIAVLQARLKGVAPPAPEAAAETPSARGRAASESGIPVAPPPPAALPPKAPSSKTPPNKPASRFSFSSFIGGKPKATEADTEDLPVPAPAPAPVPAPVPISVASPPAPAAVNVGPSNEWASFDEPSFAPAPMPAFTAHRAPAPAPSPAPVHVPFPSAAPAPAGFGNFAPTPASNPWAPVNAPFPAPAPAPAGFGVGFDDGGFGGFDPFAASAAPAPAPPPPARTYAEVPFPAPAPAPTPAAADPFSEWAGSSAPAPAPAMNPFRPAPTPAPAPVPVHVPFPAPAPVATHAPRPGESGYLDPFNAHAPDQKGINPFEDMFQ